MRLHTLAIIFTLLISAGTAQAQSAVDISCDTLTGTDYQIRLRYKGFDPRDNVGAPVDVRMNGRSLKASLFQSAVEPAGQRLYLEIVLDDLATPTTDRVLSLMATWMGDRGEVVWAQGVMVETLYRHKEGKATDGPELRVQCLVDGLPGSLRAR